MFPLRDSTLLNPPSQGREKKTAQQIARLRNKCAITDYGHTELVSISCDLTPSPAFQAPSAQGRQGHTYASALRFPLFYKERGSNFPDMDFSRFTLPPYSPIVLSPYYLF